MIETPRERHTVNAERNGNDDIAFKPHANINEETNNEDDPRSGTPFLIPQNSPRDHNVEDQHGKPHPAHWT